MQLDIDLNKLDIEELKVVVKLLDKSRQKTATVAATPPPAQERKFGRHLTGKALKIALSETVKLVNRGLPKTVAYKRVTGKGLGGSVQKKLDKMLGLTSAGLPDKRVERLVVVNRYAKEFQNQGMSHSEALREAHKKIRESKF